MKTLQHLDIGLVNCAQCECELLGERTAAMLDTGAARLAKGVVVPPRVAMRAGGRPYCHGCSGERVPTGMDDIYDTATNLDRARHHGTDYLARPHLGGDYDGGWDNAIRAYEGD